MRFLSFFAVVLLSIAASPVFAQDVDFLFSLADTNHDDAIDRNEAMGFAAMQWSNIDRKNHGSVTAAIINENPNARRLVGSLMPGADGVLTRQAFLAAQTEKFVKADRNGDGVLDVAEFRLYLGIPPAPPQATTVIPAPLFASIADPYPANLPSCEDLGRDPRYGLSGQVGVSSISAKKMLAANNDAAYCRIQFVYNSGLSGPKDGYDLGQSQAIGIRVGLPLRKGDGGDDSGVIGWNGRIENRGSGGCMGNLPSVTVATNGGFAGSSSDGGHGAPYMGFNCGFGVIQAKRELNRGLIRDFSAEHVRWQTLWTKKLVKAYYGQPAKRTYWSGCSQGGREGHIALQSIPEEYDGIAAGAAALYWMRFQMAQAWSGVVIKDKLRSKGKDFTVAQIEQTVKQEVAACDAVDGVNDGVLADPRQCHWSARAAVCGVKGASNDTCLDADQADAFDLIRRGPRNHLGKMIWFPWEPGTTFSNQSDYLLSDSVMQWTLRDLTFKSDAHLYIDKASLERSNDSHGITYEDMATLASQQISDLVDMDNTSIEAAKKSGVKFLAWTGTADRNIPSRNSIKYYRDVAAHFGQNVDDPTLQSWYRLFLYPGVDHCAGGVGPQPGNFYNGPLFHALVNWVEKDQAPSQITARNSDPSGKVTRTRPVCAYPKYAGYSGKGSIDDAANFKCEGNLETKEIVAQDVITPHKKENGSGVVPKLFIAAQPAQSEHTVPKPNVEITK